MQRDDDHAQECRTHPDACLLLPNTPVRAHGKTPQSANTSAADVTPSDPGQKGQPSKWMTLVNEPKHAHVPSGHAHDA
jgi:hypothetical protein